MALSRKEAYTIGLNVFARVGATGDFIGEYSKTIRDYNKINTFNEMNTPVVPQEAVPEPISTEPTQGIPPESNMP